MLSGVSLPPKCLTLPSFMKYHPLHTDIERPARFTYPFCYELHPLCLLAAQEVQQELSCHRFLLYERSKNDRARIPMMISSTLIKNPFFFVFFTDCSFPFHAVSGMCGKDRHRREHVFHFAMLSTISSSPVK